MMNKPRKKKESEFKLCVVRVDGSTVTFVPGSQEEYDFVDSVVERVLARMPYSTHIDEVLRRLEKRGLGYMTSQSKVLEAVKAEILQMEQTYDRSESFEEVLTKAIHDVLYLVKSEVQPST